MKVLHVIDSGGMYGAEVMLLNLVGEQIRRGLNPTVGSIGACGCAEKPLEKAAEQEGYRVQKFRMRNGPNFLGALDIVRYCAENNFDIMHSHGYKGNILLGFLPRRLRKLPLVSTIHGWTNPNRFNKMMLYEWLDRKSLRYIDSVVAVNKAMLSLPGLCNCNHSNITVINNGIQPYFFAGQANEQDPKLDREIMAFCRQGFTVGAMGRLSPEKGYHQLIRAVARLAENTEDIRLVIIGEGNQRRELERLAAALNLTSRILLPGYRKNARDYLPHFSVFVLSSLTEGLPITLLEAMQAGTPVVATSVGGIPFVIEDGETGLLVAPADVGELAERIHTIRQDPALGAKLTEQSRQVVNSKYTSTIMAARYAELYTTLLRP